MMFDDYDDVSGLDMRADKEIQKGFWKEKETKHLHSAVVSEANEVYLVMLMCGGIPLHMTKAYVTQVKNEKKVKEKRKEGKRGQYGVASSMPILFW